MHNLTEYLRNQSITRKKYESCLINSSVTENNVIDDIDLVIENKPITYELIDNYITASLCTDYDSTNPKRYWDNIYETLVKSHNHNKLIERLKKYFGINWSASYETDSMRNSTVKSFEFYLEDCDIAKKILDYTRSKKYTKEEQSELPEELIKILDFFNYYFSSVKISHGPDGEVSYKILCEPKYSDKVNDLVYKEYNGILYHITLKENVERILKRGLQLKGDKNVYRYIEPRINFYLAKDSKIEQYGKRIANQKGYKDGDWTILKIDLNYGDKNKYNSSSYSIDFYHDNLYTEDWSVYTYGLVHPRFITEYTN